MRLLVAVGVVVVFGVAGARLPIAGRAVFAFVRSPAPPSRALPGGVADVRFSDAAHGFAVTVASGAAVDGSGVGRLEATSDGGASWRTVWSRGRASLEWVGFASAEDWFAAGDSYPAGYPRARAARPLLLRSVDGGRRWRALRPLLPRATVDLWGGLEFQFVSRDVGFASVDPDLSFWATQLLRTDDGGRHWRVLRTGLTGFQFLDARHGYATGPEGRESCVFATDDGGRTWRVLASSCRSFQLMTVDFLDARTGFAAGGTPYYVAIHPTQAVLVTHDGGRSWRTLFVGTPSAARGYRSSAHRWPMHTTVLRSPATASRGKTRPAAVPCSRPTTAVAAGATPAGRQCSSRPPARRGRGLCRPASAAAA